MDLKLIKGLLPLVAIAWVIFGVYMLVTLAADVYGKSPTDSDFGWEIWYYAAGTDIGQAWFISTAVMIVVSAALPTIADKPEIVGSKNASRQKFLYFVGGIAILLPLDRMFRTIISVGAPDNPTPAWLLTGRILPPEPVFPDLLLVWDFSLYWFVLLLGLLICIFYSRLRRSDNASAAALKTLINWPSIGLLIIVFVFAGFGFLQYYQVFSFPIGVSLFFVWLLVIPVITRRIWIITLKGLFIGTFLVAVSPYLVFFTPIYRWLLEVPSLLLLLPLGLMYLGWRFFTGLSSSEYSLGQKTTALAVVVASLAGFGALVSLSNTLLVSDWFSALGRDWMPDLLSDQQSAGVWIFVISASLALFGSMVIRFGKRRENLIG
ncbi:MAG: hypothetical protein KF916_04275 [Microbacteriaceae bacterium]|nr:hypothetical protein [Microbacteriaceae bacterium]